MFVYWTLKELQTWTDNSQMHFNNALCHNAPQYNALSNALAHTSVTDILLTLFILTISIESIILLTVCHNIPFGHNGVHDHYGMI